MSLCLRAASGHGAPPGEKGKGDQRAPEVIGSPTGVRLYENCGDGFERSPAKGLDLALGPGPEISLNEPGEVGHGGVLTIARVRRHF